ncbi:MAG: peptide deformylase [Pseudomonadota bacterium]|nr:peptide deformylase [Pseudomonadota bacterium]
MAVLDILHFPDPRLREKAKAVAEVDERIRQLVSDMLETMYDASGVGLAAIQVNVRERVIVADVSDNRDEPLHFINPEIVWQEGGKESDEGCLSVPGIYEPVRRAEKIRVKALNTEGESFELEADGLLSVCIQHEIDHLNGKLFVDYLSELKRQRIRKRLAKAQRQQPGSPEAARI